MAQLSENSWYVWYLREVEAGHLKLPEFDTNAGGEVQIHYGEVYCRVDECGKRKKRFSSTNNLRSHVRSHDGVILGKDDKGGRVSQGEVDSAGAFSVAKA
ncbi:hypothetical protein ASPACDRAFT_38391 [Aspergillus aculeatus ATCC 16872]|uniref:C2H2-type domain-containing protein n=1 Tax=Aspergillus aculeatus (strain ATCC 16872 / CBS 172.66 / WB 5094) TaxID=690307 RepID=A0A1L9X8R9_ASPA1|nr:uncharacterized protein ASPACDRAFT_38391 [Aspergillus aculeatus ATCC 16872]OJK04835.1 hypothetical protein ASPACDRAFT_38391 [Aspergillus aculeatus ATCC 16872]